MAAVNTESFVPGTAADVPGESWQATDRGLIYAAGVHLWGDTRTKICDFSCSLHRLTVLSFS
eukprot:182009-Amphidinium_carterae.1